jgi:hypothetical protein
MLTDAEIFRRLRTIKHSSPTERNARRAPSIHGLAQHAGLTTAAIYQVLKKGSLGRVSRPALALALETYQHVHRARSSGHTLEDAARGRF